ncbi:Glutamyl-tRNA reductase [uncultured Roseburia sp.]|uniref:Glutamyl-tRNA reductase n=1 Tax=Brotonthovivens ammoniilytica TaxID=2981725 RepID=A0ABT2TML1_9FIRM|nr:glutamyl-tRNA reductase [Brotonthovivens ammoniilytica]MCU6763332.1 glutamyl-tRNA reductase [Brotonthovivens ammoniilytica]SCJ13790.1 Glutamyl-tRNA reductase [uncultured Roseburia sp.]
MGIQMIGIDHTTADVDTRALFSFTKKSSAEMMLNLKEQPGIMGCIIISTCNRMELWLSTEETFDEDLLELLCRQKQVEKEAYESAFIYRQGHEAAEHLFWLTCGLKSQILAEDQIISQVKDALSWARENFTTDGVLEVLFRKAVTAAKEVKTKVVFSRANETAMDQAILMLKKRGFLFDRSTCMVIGNGEMGKLAAQSLQQTGADVTVTVRQYRSGMVNIPLGCSRINYGERMEFLPECDLVVSATASPNFTLTRELLEQVEIRPKGKKLILIDLAVPRDIDPKAGGLEWVRLYDIDDFKLNDMSDKVRQSVNEARRILDKEMEEFYSWLQGRDMIPRIQEVKASAVEDLYLRIHKVLGRLPLEEEQKKALKNSIDTAAGKVIMKLIFGLRDSLDKEEFLDCLEGLEEVYDE